MSLFYPGAPKSTVSLWERFDQRMNGADFKGSDNFQLSCTLFIPPAAPSIPLSLFSSLPPWKQKKRGGWFVFGERTLKDSLTLAIQTNLCLPSHVSSSFITLLSVSFPYSYHSCHCLCACLLNTRSFKLCIAKTCHFLCCLCPLPSSLSFFWLVMFPLWFGDDWLPLPGCCFQAAGAWSCCKSHHQLVLLSSLFRLSLHHLHKEMERGSQIKKGRTKKIIIKIKRKDRKS